MPLKITGSTKITGTDFKGLTALARRMKGARTTVLVGVPFDAKPEGVSSGGAAVSVVDVAVWNEFGTSKIPERAFLRKGIRRDVEKMRKLNQIELVKIVRGEETEDNALKALGHLAANSVQEEIVKGDWVPNAPSTIRKKGSSKPLIDSGNLRQAITFRLERPGQEEITSASEPL